eukprot:2107317-Prymnesium_polylepis.1
MGRVGRWWRWWRRWWRRWLAAGRHTCRLNGSVSSESKWRAIVGRSTTLPDGSRTGSSMISAVISSRNSSGTCGPNPKRGDPSEGAVGGQRRAHEAAAGLGRRSQE